MGLIMIHCPQTGREISTGIEVDTAAHSRSPVFFSRSYCPICKVDHVWFAKDAWVREDDPTIDTWEHCDGAVRP
jgi:hypothetical protein